MTTPRDDIAGLSERLRADANEIAGWGAGNEATRVKQAATQLAALNKERDELYQRLDTAAQMDREKTVRVVDAEARADALSARVKELEEFTKELSNALLACRPLGGSELFVKRFGQYYADPVYCKAAIEADRTKYHEAMCDAVRERKRALRAEQERDTLSQVIDDTVRELGCPSDNEEILFAIDRLKQERDEAAELIRPLAILAEDTARVSSKHGSEFAPEMSSLAARARSFVRRLASGPEKEKKE